MSAQSNRLGSIALLTPGVTPYVTGGLQRHSFNLAKYLARKGVKVDLYHTRFSQGQDINQLEGLSHAEREQITSISIPWKADRFPGHYIRSLKRFSRMAYDIYDTRPAVDFIIGKSITAWTFVEAKRQGRKLPPIAVNFHGYEMFQHRPTIRTKMEAAMLRPDFRQHARGADFLLSYGGKITDIVETSLRLQRSRIIEIPGGTDPALIVPNVPPTSEKRRFVFLGRYERRKGIEELNAAITANPIWQQKCEFVFIGGISPDVRLNITHVSYLGEIRNVSEIQSHFSQSDILLCPSHSEGMPNVIMEGMAAGLAILATDVGAVSLLVSEKNGVVLPSPTAKGIGQAIEQFLSMPDETLDSMKHCSLAHIKNFGWPAIADQTCNLLSEVLNNPNEGASR